MPSTLVIGHRGAAAVLPENTMESFRHAFDEAKAEAIEFDVRFSRDQVPIIIHDATLERTTSGCGYVSHQTFAELQHFQVPSLEELLRVFKTKTLLVEIKDRSAELVQAVMKLIEKYHAGERCIVGSKHHLVAATLAKHYPAQRRFLSQREIVQEFLAWRTKMVPGTLRDRFIEPVPAVPGTKLKRVASMPLEGCGMHFDDPKFLEWLHSKKITAYFWTINDPKEVQRLSAVGADGIITDNPSAARQALGLRN